MKIRVSGRLDLAFVLPRWAALLQLVEIDVETVASGVYETCRSGECPQGHVLCPAEAKALAVSRPHLQVLVLGADTVEVIDGAALEKPESIREAVTMLEKMSGREREAFAGLSIAWQSEGVHLGAIEFNGGGHDHRR